MNATRSRSLRSAALLLAALLLTSCDVLGITLGGSGRRRELERQQAKWASQNVTAYRLTYRRECFCGTEFTNPTQIEVRGGAIVTAHYTERDAPIPTYVQTNLPTVETLFAIIAQAIDREADLLDVTYDPLRGYPRRIAIDYRFNTADDEVTHAVSSLEIFLPPISP